MATLPSHGVGKHNTGACPVVELPYRHLVCPDRAASWCLDVMGDFGKTSLLVALVLALVVCMLLAVAYA